MHANGYLVVIISNQSGVSKGTTNVNDITGKIEDMSKELGFDLSAMVACNHDVNRKPSVGMWKHLVGAAAHDGIATSDSWYCGDAAGRHKAWDGNKKTKKDFACSDRMFAANVGIKFYTPEEFFLGVPTTDKWSWGSVDPRSLMLAVPKPQIEVSPLKRELLLMVGCPASGKTTWSKRFASSGDYVRVCNDEVGNKKKAQHLAMEALRNNKSVIVDNTNPSAETRKEWIDLAKSVGVSAIRCVHVQTDRAVAEHLNVFRSVVSTRVRVPDIAFNIYFSHFKAPSVDEGFNAIVTVSFVLEPFNDRETEELFMQWTC